MNIDIKTILPYLVILISIGMTWGMWSARLEAVERKAETVNEIQQDIAVIKEKIIWIEKYLNGD
tara:strand:- start:456 stop:647 length:192 start_codon:yes stop_codon:yes gene_type:complete